MVGTWREQIYNIGNNWFSNTVLQETSSNNANKTRYKSICNQTFAGHDSNSARPLESKNIAACYKRNAQFYLQAISSEEKRRIDATYFRSTRIEQIRTDKAFSPYLSQFSTRFSPTGRLDDKIRHFSGILHVAAAKSHCPFLRISYLGQLYEMTCLPFGLASAPHLFSSITCWVAETLRAKGCRVLVYLDDYLLVNQDQSKLCLQASAAVRHLEYLGWSLNYQKSILTPTQDLVYLGIRLQTAKNRMSLPEKRIQSLKATIDRSLLRGHITLRELQSLLAQLNFASFVIPRGRLHCRKSQIFLRHFNKRQPRQRQLIPNTVYQEMRWWLGATRHSSLIHKKPATHFLATDASDLGWGAHLDGHLMLGTWSPQ